MRNKLITNTILSALLGVVFTWSAPALAETSISSPPAEQKELVESGTVEVKAQQVRLIVGGAKGTGVLHFNGKKYKFKMSGASVGGVGVTSVDAVGTVYNLKDIKYFPGVYAGMGVGAAAVEGAGASSWENKGVVIKMKSKTEGLALNLGINSVKVELVK